MYELIETFSDNELRELLREIKKLDSLVAPANEKLSANMQKLFDNSTGYYWSSKMRTVEFLLTFSATERFLNG